MIDNQLKDPENATKFVAVVYREMCYKVKRLIRTYK